MNGWKHKMSVNSWHKNYTSSTAIVPSSIVWSVDADCSSSSSSSIETTSRIGQSTISCFHQQHQQCMQQHSIQHNTTLHNSLWDYHCCYYYIVIYYFAVCPYSSLCGNRWINCHLFVCFVLFWSRWGILNLCILYKTTVHNNRLANLQNATKINTQAECAMNKFGGNNF